MTIHSEDTEYLLVDGYNIIFAWDELQRLAAQDIAARAVRSSTFSPTIRAFSQCRVIVVFDAYKVKGNPGSVQTVHGVKVVHHQRRGIPEHGRAAAQRRGICSTCSRWCMPSPWAWRICWLFTGAVPAEGAAHHAQRRRGQPHRLLEPVWEQLMLAALGAVLGAGLCLALGWGTALGLGLTAAFAVLWLLGGPWPCARPTAAIF